MVLTKLATEKLGNDEVKMKIALELGKSYITMRRWIHNHKHHPKLLDKEVLIAIEKFTGLKENELFEFESITYKSLSNN